MQLIIIGVATTLISHIPFIVYDYFAYAVPMASMALSMKIMAAVALVSLTVSAFFFIRHLWRRV